MQIIRDDKCARTERGTAHHTSQARRTQERTQNWASVVGAGPKTCPGSSKKGNNGNGRAPPWSTQATTSIRDKLQSQGGGEHDCGPHVSVRPVPARPTDIHPSVRPARAINQCCDPPPLVPTFVRPAFVASVFDWFLNYLGCCALSLFCANYVTKP